MSNVFFGKMNNPNQMEKKIYETEDKGFFGDIAEGDYAFIKLEKETSPATVKRLWKLKEIKQMGDVWQGIFDEIFEFTPIPLSRFEALPFFQLDMNLLNKCNKQTKGLSFYKLTIVDEALFFKEISSKDTFNTFISNDLNYRKIVALEDKSNINPKSIDVQFFRENESWQIYNGAAFIGEDLKADFDTNQYNLFDKHGPKGRNTSKEKMYRFLSGERIEVPIIGLWDLFCGTVKENTNQIKIKNSTAKRVDFIEFCKSNGVERASSQYESGIRSLEKELEVNADTEFEKDKCRELQNRINSYLKTLSEEQIGNRRNWTVYVGKYIEFKESLQEIDNDDLKENIQTLYDYNSAKHHGENKVFYGTPGCGKSYYLENSILQQEGFDIDNSVFRTTFYQDYTNSDFVGQILPQVYGDKVSYDFIPGPFTLALKAAIDNSEEKIALVIEELNRGNAPSIFGDIFQLLDRIGGTSKYKIVNIHIQNYLKKECTYDLDYIKIPSNLYIYATMNTSDQNVFTLDTAFKRRWKFEKITNEFTGNDSIGTKLVPGFQDVSWKKFVETINKHIVSNATSFSAEDKQLGKYFVEQELLMDSMDDYSEKQVRDFSYKVFEYLWSDVAKFNRSAWFSEDIKSLDILIWKIMAHANPFILPLASELPIYTPSEEDE